MPYFPPLSTEENLQDVIKSAFDSDIPISGSWGYTQESVTLITRLDIPINQFEHIFASMRAYIEMNMTRVKEERYGSINVNELSREDVIIDGQSFHKLNYEITAMKEDIYASFIKEYKENYGKERFDLTAHFNKRKEATLHREVTHWFKRVN